LINKRLSAPESRYVKYLACIHETGSIWTKRMKQAGGWRRLQNEELRNLYTSPNVIRVMKSRRMRWVGH